MGETTLLPNSGAIEMQAARMVCLGSLLAAVAVGLGAVGAHVLKAQLAPEQLETFQTAVHYQMTHAIGLVLVGLLSLHRRSRLFAVAGWAMLVGIILFSGFLFAWLATGWKVFVYPVPIGGISFIFAWLVLAVAAAKEIVEMRSSLRQ